MQAAIQRCRNRPVGGHSRRHARIAGGVFEHQKNFGLGTACGGRRYRRQTAKLHSWLAVLMLLTLIRINSISYIWHYDGYSLRADDSDLCIKTRLMTCLNRIGNSVRLPGCEFNALYCYSTVPKAGGADGQRHFGHCGGADYSQ